MDKKKLQDFISKLQEMAVQLNDIEDSKEIISDKSLDSDSEPIKSEVNTISTNAISSSYANYITIKKSDGTVINYNSNFTLEHNDYITVEIDYAALIATEGYTVNNIQGCNMIFCGRTKRFHAGVSIYSLNNNQFVGENAGVNNTYGVDLYYLYKTYGTANFKLVAEWDGGENLLVNSITIGTPTIQSITVITPPTQVSYCVGDAFNMAGMVVQAQYSNGMVAPYTGYTIAPLAGLTTDDTYVTIFADQPGYNIFTQQAITVSRNKVHTDQYVYSRYRANEDEEWSEWQSINNTIISVNGGLICQTKTLIRIDKSKIDLGNADKAGIHIMLYRNTSQPIDSVKHFRINNMRYAINHHFANQIFYAGEVKAGETGYFDILLEHDDSYLEFKLNNEDTDIANIYFTRGYNYQAKKELKTIPLAEGELQVNLCNGEYKYEIDLIKRESTPLGVKLSTVFAPNEGGDGCGFYGRLNIAEHFDFESIDYNEYIKTHTYTDSYGNRTNFKVVFYYIENGERKYITGDAIKDITVVKIGEVVVNFTYNNYFVFIEHIAPDYHVFVETPSNIVLNNTYYKSVLNDSGNKINLPIYWLSNGQTTKGFNYNGDLVFITDEYDNYTAIIYNSNRRITSIEDKYGNYIHINYLTNNNISYIVDSRNRKVTFDYTEALISSVCKPKITKIEFATLEADGSTETEYKSVSFSYTSKRINGTVGYVLTSVISSDGKQSNIAFDSDTLNAKVINVTNYASAVPDDDSTSKSVLNYSIQYDFGNNITKVTDINGVQEEYTFNDDYNLCEYCVIKNDKVAECRKYVYKEFSQYSVVYAKKSTLNKYTPSQFSFQGEDSEYSELNYLDKIQQKIKTHFTENSKIVSEINYNYNDNHRVVSSDAVTEYFNSAGDSLLHKERVYTNYVYNSSKQVLNKISSHYSHFNGDAEVKDKSYVVEYTYDSNGNPTKETSYSGAWTTHAASGTCTCDFSTSDKFYSQYAYDAFGRIAQSKTQDGLYHDAFTYYDGTMNVHKIAHTGRSEVIYSYNNEDNLTKVSSTNSGLENYALTEYDLGETVKFNHAGNKPIEFEYESKRRISKIKLNGNDYISFSYEDKVADGDYTVDKVTATNAKNEVMVAVTDRAGCFDKTYYNSALLLQRTYDCNGYLITAQDSLAGATENYTRDIDGNIKTYTYAKGGENYNEVIGYDYKGNVTQVNHGGTVVRTDVYTYAADCDNHLTQIVTGSNITITPQWDISNRYTGASVALSDLQLIENIGYYKQGDHATNLPKVYNYLVKKNSTVKYSGQMSLTYDESENIKNITIDGKSIDYIYDSLGRLIREENEQLNQVYTYSYDNNGNILTKKIGSTTITYSYDGDKLVSYNGQACVYDTLGNPTTYRGKTATWQRGRKLISYDGNTFSYDAYGRRLSKNNIKFYYDSNGKLLKQSNGLEFYYDAVGVIAIKYSGEIYLCAKDVLGNIIALIDSNGNPVVQYWYDAWGNHKVVDVNGNEITDSTHMGNLNPFRYRGYYFDRETGLYFLQTRYYDPEIGRFINIDSIEYADPQTINGLNLYAYCLNNPIKYVDPKGNNVVDSISAILEWIGLVSKIGINFILGLSKTQSVGSNAKYLANLFKNFGYGFSSVLSFMGNALIGVSNIIEGFSDNKSFLNITTDTVFDITAISLGTAIGAAIGSVIPVVGTFVGGAIGGALSFTYTNFESSQIIQETKQSFFDGVNQIVGDFVDIFHSINKACEDFLNYINNSITSFIRNIFGW